MLAAISNVELAAKGGMEVEGGSGGGEVMVDVQGVFN